MRDLKRILATPSWLNFELCCTIIDHCEKESLEEVIQTTADQLERWPDALRWKRVSLDNPARQLLTPSWQLVRHATISASQVCDLPAAFWDNINGLTLDGDTYPATLHALSECGVIERLGKLEFYSQSQPKDLHEPILSASLRNLYSLHAPNGLLKLLAKEDADMSLACAGFSNPDDLSQCLPILGSLSELTLFESHSSSQLDWVLPQTVQHLRVYCPKDNTCEFVATTRELLSLELFGPKFSIPGFKRLFIDNHKLESLQNLNYYHSGPPSPWMDDAATLEALSLSNYSNLRHLDITGWETNCNVGSFSPAQSLNSLRLTGVSDRFAIPIVGSLTASVLCIDLAEGTLSSSAGTELAHNHSIGNLRSLRVPLATREEVSALKESSIKRVDHLEISCTRSSERVLEKIDNLEMLRSAETVTVACGRSSIASIASIPFDRLYSLDLRSDFASDVDLQSISKNHHLESLLRLRLTGLRRFSETSISQLLSSRHLFRLCELCLPEFEQDEYEDEDDYPELELHQRFVDNPDFERLSATPDLFTDDLDDTAVFPPLTTYEAMQFSDVLAFFDRARKHL